MNPEASGAPLPPAPIPPLDWMARAPFSLALSGGFFGFFAHTGFLLALREAGLRPRRIVGVSAGALAGGLVAAGVAPETLAQRLCEIRREDFWDRAFPWFGLLPGRRFDALLADILRPVGVRRIEDCPTPFAAVACDLGLRARALDVGSLSSAIRASCAVLPLFRPVRHAGRLHIDGGLRDRLGEAALSGGERAVLHVLPPRSREKATPAPPESPLRRVLWIPDLPRVDPRRLDAGSVAIERARTATARWLRGGDAPA